MIIRRITVSIFLSLLLIGMVNGQSLYRDSENQTTGKFLRDHVNPIPLQGILDPSRISMHHQVGMSYSSFGGNGYSQGYYLNTLSYKFNAPLRLNVRMGVTNNPFVSQSPGSNGFGPNLGEAEFFGGADLNWKPADNVYVRFSIDRIPAGYNSYYGYGPYSRYPYSALDMANDPFYSFPYSDFR